MTIRPVVILLRVPIRLENDPQGVRTKIELVVQRVEWSNHVAEFTTVAGDEIVIPWLSIAWIELGAETEQA